MATATKKAAPKAAKESQTKTNAAKAAATDKAAEKASAKSAKAAIAAAARKAAVDAGDIITFKGEGDEVVEYTVATPNSITVTDERAAKFLGLVKQAKKRPVLISELTEKLGCYPDATAFWASILEQQGLVKRFSLTSHSERGKKPVALLWIGE